MRLDYPLLAVRLLAYRKARATGRTDAERLLPEPLAADYAIDKARPLNDSIWLLVFVGLFVAGLAGLFLYGWLRRKERPPPGVKPLPDEDDDWGR